MNNTQDTTTPDDSGPKSFQEFLGSLDNAPTADQIKALKAEVPNGAIRGFSPDGKRCFLMRGISGVEMRELQKGIPANSSDPEAEFKVVADCAACVWTNVSRTGKLDPLSLRAATAGLPDTLFAIVENLSDFFAPAQIHQMSFDL